MQKSFLNEPIFQKDNYELGLPRYGDFQNALETAVDEAVAGNKIEIAKNMLADNEPNEKVAKYTGLSLEQIQKLRAALKK